MYRFPDFRMLLICGLITLLAKAALASPQATSAICERAAFEAAQKSGVPLDVLRAISLTETGRKKNGSFQPWPWTVNMEGLGKWFDSYAAAKTYVDKHFERGARSFDVGCFQINYRWHHQGFTSIEQMFEPRANALYAAKFLSDLYQEFGDWSKAAGAYHSRTPKYAKKYSARFKRIRAQLGAPPSIELAQVTRQPPEPETPLVRVNRFPLLQRGTQGRLASLVPLGQPTSERLIDINQTASRPLK